MLKSTLFSIILALVMPTSGGFAQTASIGGTAVLTINPTITTTNIFDASGNLTGQTIQTVGGFTSSVSAEAVLPNGLFFGGPVVVTPSYSPANLVNSLSVSGGSIGVVPENSTFNRAAAQILINGAAGSSNIINNIEPISAIIRAGAGVGGLD